MSNLLPKRFSIYTFNPMDEDRKQTHYEAREEMGAQALALRADFTRQGLSCSDYGTAVERVVSHVRHAYPAQPCTLNLVREVDDGVVEVYVHAWGGPVYVSTYDRQNESWEYSLPEVF